MMRTLRYAGAGLLGVCLAAPLLAGPAGFGVHRVETGSMAGTYDPVSVVLTQRGTGEVAVGDVIRVDADRTDDDEGFIHRVVELVRAPDGAVAGYVTRGDANDHNDIDPASREAVAGVVVGALTGRAAAVYAVWRTIPAQVVAAVLMVLLWPASKTRSRRTRPATHRARVRTDQHAPDRDETGRTGAGVTGSPRGQHPRAAGGWGGGAPVPHAGRGGPPPATPPGRRWPRGT